MLGIYYIQPVPLAHEPSVVARMAKQLSTYKEQEAKGWLAGLGADDAMTKIDTYGGTIFKLALAGGLLVTLGLSYRSCVKRGACG